MFSGYRYIEVWKSIEIGLGVDLLGFASMYH